MASDDNLLNDDEIQKLLDAAGGSSPAPPEPAAGADKPQAEPTAADTSAATLDAPAPDAAQSAASRPTGRPADSTFADTSADELLSQVEAGLNAALSEGTSSGNVVGGIDGAVPFELSDFGDASAGSSGQRFSLGTLDDVELELQIELGRAELLIEEVLSLREGAVVPLDKLAGDPVDILVNGRLLARGEVLVLNDNFCVRVAEIVSPDF
ncbi:MAG: flagellar motor switch protein FliN [Planctomycetota bacterium]